MKAIFQSSLAILLSGSALLGCVKLPEAPKTKGFEFKFDLGATDAEPVPHKASECPVISGSYVRESNDGGKVSKVVELSEVSGELILTVDGAQLVVNGTTIPKDEVNLKTGKLQKSLIAGYSAGCVEDSVVVDLSVVGRKIGRTTYRGQEDMLYVTTSDPELPDSIAKSQTQIWHKASN